MTGRSDDQHRYGQHYTPEVVARLLAAFAVRSAGDLVFDPSCGDGRLLKEALRIKESLAGHGPEVYKLDAARSRAERGTGRGDKARREEVLGIDRSAPAVRLAAQTGAGVARADFFDLEPGAGLPGGITLPAEFDAVIGNPPYIRQELMGQEEKQRIRRRLNPAPSGSRSRRPGGRLAQLRPDPPFDASGTAMSASPLDSEGIFLPGWSGRSDIYIYFFAHAARFLRARGRLVFLTSSSWLDVSYGMPLRQFFLKNFRILAVIESAAESFFADASINTTVTVLEREPDDAARKANQVRFVQLISPLEQIYESQLPPPRSPGRHDPALEFARTIERASSTLAPGMFRVRVASQCELLNEMGGALRTHARSPSMETVHRVSSNWGKYLRADDVFFEVLKRGSARLRPLADMASVRFGVKTGANQFFYMSRLEAGELELDDPPANEPGRAGRGMKSLGEVASVRRGLTTGANEFFYLKTIDNEPAPDQTPAGLAVAGIRRRDSRVKVVRDWSGKRRTIESRYLAPIIFSLKEIPRIIIENAGGKKLLFNCATEPARLAGSKALLYIRKGEAAGYAARPTCAARDPWYRVARDRKPAPLILPSKVGERWLVAMNRAGAFEDKKLYGVFPRDGVSTKQLAAVLNSTWARYYAEITCRQMTGAQAIADIDVAVAEQIVLPDPRGLAVRDQSRLEAALDALATRPILSIFEEVGRADRQILDDLVLKAIGFGDETERRAILSRLYDAVTELVRARIARSLNAKKPGAR